MYLSCNMFFHGVKQKECATSWAIHILHLYLAAFKGTMGEIILVLSPINMLCKLMRPSEHDLATQTALCQWTSQLLQPIVFQKSCSTSRLWKGGSVCLILWNPCQSTRACGKRRSSENNLGPCFLHLNIFLLLLIAALSTKNYKQLLL